MVITPGERGSGEPAGCGSPEAAPDAVSGGVKEGFRGKDL